MIENTGVYGLAKDRLPQKLRNRFRSTSRLVIDSYAGIRGLSAKRATPDFLIIGAQKAGTTSLFNWLVESGFTQPPIVKEVHYFDTLWDWPINYRGYFPVRKAGCIVGEATPSYLAFPEVAERVFQTLGSDCKIICVLRDPVSRSVSQYYHGYRLGSEIRDMYTAMTEEDTLMAEAFAPGTSAKRRQHIITNCSYVYRSRYSERLTPWFKQFDRSNMLLLKSEDMFRNPSVAVESVADFLSCKIETPTGYKPRNTNAYVFEDKRVEGFLKDKLRDETQIYNDWAY